MNRKDAAKRAAEEQVLEHLKGWPNGVTVHEMSLEMGWPWQQMAKVLLRIVAHGGARMMESTRKDPHYRVRVVRRFAPIGQRCRLPERFEPRPVDPGQPGRVVRFPLDG